MRTEFTVHFLTGVPPSCHFKLAWMLPCLTIGTWVSGGCDSPPAVFQCRLQKLDFLQWHPNVGQFQLNFSIVFPVQVKIVKVSPVAFQRGAVSNKFFQWCSSIHWVNQWHSSGIRVYTGPASVHWLSILDCKYRLISARFLYFTQHTLDVVKCRISM